MARDGPICAVQGCDRFATEQIHNVEVRGVSCDVYVCGECRDEMDEPETVEAPLP